MTTNQMQGNGHAPSTQCHWLHGWLAGITHTESPNFSMRPEGEIVDLVVIHNISLPPFEYGSGAVSALFTNRIAEHGKHPFYSLLGNLRVSSHFFIDREGEVVQFVSCNNMAYHAGISSFEGREQCNRFSIGIEMEGCDFEPFTEAQYITLEALLHNICTVYPIKAITGHQHIAPYRKTDPGHFFDWQRLKQAGFCIKT